eukprot:scaffold26033_cov104-Isochrysis_galbana.AAC.1
MGRVGQGECSTGAHSKTTYEMEMAGTALSRLGSKPWYRARGPPSRTVCLKQSTRPVYRAGCPGIPAA